MAVSGADQSSALLWTHICCLAGLHLAMHQVRHHTPDLQSLSGVCSQAGSKLQSRWKVWYESLFWKTRTFSCKTGAALPEEVLHMGCCWSSYSSSWNKHLWRSVLVCFQVWISRKGHVTVLLPLLFMGLEGRICKTKYSQSCGSGERSCTGPRKEKTGGEAHKRQDLSLLAGSCPPWHEEERAWSYLALQRGNQGSGLPGAHLQHLPSGRPGRTLKSLLSRGVSCSVPSSTLRTSLCTSQAAGTGQSDICLWEGDLVPVHWEAEFALTESIKCFGCDGEQDLARLAVNSTTAFSAHSYCQGGNYSRAYFPIQLIWIIHLPWSLFEARRD